jgi:hypothetical protein
MRGFGICIPYPAFDGGNHSHHERVERKTGIKTAVLE